MAGWVSNSYEIAEGWFRNFKPKSRTGIDVFGTMDGRIDLVLDGGVCGGVGSTTIDITEPYWRVIKEGVIAEKEIGESLKDL